MRLFLSIKNKGRKIATRRIQIKSNTSNTTDFLNQISEQIQQKPSNIIVSFVREHYKLRIIPGQTYEQYSLHSGMQIQIQIIDLFNQTEKQVSFTQKNINIVMKKSISNIREQQDCEGDDQGEQEKDINKIVVNKYQELLKYIQKGSFGRFMKQLKYPHPWLDSCQNQYYKMQLYKILNELGEKGWAAIHYAVYSNCMDSIKFLIEQKVDLNLKTIDDWLPIQLAINNDNLQALQILIEQPELDINICTSHGRPIITAVKSRKKQVILCLLKKEVDLNAKDDLGRTVYDFANEKLDPQIYKMLQQSKRRYSMIGGQQNQTYHALVSTYKGELTQIRAPPRKDKLRYFVLDPYQKLIKIYQNKDKYPDFPKEELDMLETICFKKAQKSQKSWYMKGDFTYLLVKNKKNKKFFAVNFQQTADAWISAFQQCKSNMQKYNTKIITFSKNQNSIFDRIIIESQRQKNQSVYSSNLLSFLANSIVKKEQSQLLGPAQCIDLQLSKKKNNQKQIKQQNIQKQDKPQLQKQKNHITLNNQIKQGIKFSDFKILNTLGEGAFGTVFLAKDIRNPEIDKKYALKCFKKKTLVVKKQIKYTIAQLNILKQLNHPYIVNLHFTFQTPNYVYLGLDYCPGKDLAHHLMTEVTFPYNQCILYAAQIILAIEYLHSKNIIYRDLKPQNIMIDASGHIKLVDFGLSKQGKQDKFLAKSFCGSPAYLSPQMLDKKGVGKQSDLYCVGAVLYEMLIGQPPYFSNDIETLYNNIYHEKLAFPKNLNPKAKDFLSKILQRNPKHRLGYKGINEVKEHKIFQNINWDKLLSKKIKAPQRPNEDSQNEIQDQQLIKIIHHDHDYTAQNTRINRFVNFSFQRQDNTK